jgi:hypothetical protein
MLFALCPLCFVLGYGQYHLAVAGGYAVRLFGSCFAPTRYREVVLTVSKHEAQTTEVIRFVLSEQASQ